MTATTTTISEQLKRFLDFQKFSKSELQDIDYISEKIHHFAENSGKLFSDSIAVDLAKQYSQIKLA